MRQALLWSGGLDSTVLLAMMMDAGEVFDIVQFRSHWSRAQEKRVDAIIKTKNLKVFTYPESYITFIGNEDEKSIVFDMAIGDTTVPLIRDIVDGAKCLADLDGPRCHSALFTYDKYFVGTRREDRHYAVPPYEASEWKVGCATFMAPLFDLTRNDVVTLALKYGIDPTPPPEIEDPNNISVCSRCLVKEGDVFCPKTESYIPAMGANLALNLTEFRKRFEVL